MKKMKGGKAMSYGKSSGGAVSRPLASPGAGAMGKVRPVNGPKLARKASAKG